MCGRFSQFSSRDELARLFGFDDGRLARPSAPLQHRAHADGGCGSSGRRPARPAADAVGVGAIVGGRPHHREPPHQRLRETVTDKPAFAPPSSRRRCLIPTTGFYEWVPTGGKKKQPLHIRMKDGMPFALAGLWERWHDEDGELVDSCTIITTTSNELIRPFHDRMPVIISSADFDTWLDPRTPPDQLHSLLSLSRRTRWRRSRWAATSATHATRGRSAWRRESLRDPC